MRMLMKSLLTVSAVLSLAPTAALAYPRQCFEICNDALCGEECAVGPARGRRVANTLPPGAMAWWQTPPTPRPR